ncbi:MAG: Fe-S protein assembly chaperone HscA [Gammaproteobacteria bacterium]|nr:Fe-S protein assembly chaperone HscA [Gammaproteobacteria bacterium]MCF6230899.1 Fe-S protein assembly chaperone HscA [Gammaproteobacteria bacterium]
MALLQISEPGLSAAPHQYRLAAGIDLGTTNSLVASVRNGIAEALCDESGEYILPSVVRYRENAAPQVGAQALAAASEDPLNTIASVKRLMGRGIEDIKHLGARLPYQFVAGDSQMPRIHTVVGDVSPVEISAEILKTLKLRAESTLGGELTGVVITVPAYFDDAQRQATKDAATVAGLKVMRLLNEPTAAALAYGLDQSAEGIHAIYDLGGGTFDISILRMQKGVFEVLSTGGDSALGGDDFDRVLAEWVMEQAKIDDDAKHNQLRHVMAIARRAKERLTEVESVTIKLDASFGVAWQGEITRQQFNQRVEAFVSRTLVACRRAMRDANISVDEIKEVVMVGGSTRVPLVREKVGEFFALAPLTTIDPDKVVSMGAAQQADILVGNQPADDALLLDVIPLSLGLETMGELVEKVVPRNTTIPVARAQDFTTFKDGQTAMTIHVLQGERELVSDCRSLARFTLRGIPPKAAGGAKIRVTFQVDADGLLTVSAKELTTGVESCVEVKPSYGLEASEIESMLRDSMSHAKEDLEARRLREAQVEANRLVESVDVALNADARLLSDQERAAIEQALSALKAVMNGDDHSAIQQNSSVLQKATADFAARRMDASIKQVLAGHQVDDI